MRVRVDVGGIDEVTRKALRSIRRAPREMQRILARKAAIERRTHEYQNRTHNLEDSTFASEVRKEGDKHIVEFGARTFYSSYVDNRGLMRLHEFAAEAETEIDYYLDGEVMRLGGS